MCSYVLKFRKTLLFAAARNGDVNDVVKYLAEEAEVDLNQTDKVLFIVIDKKTHVITTCVCLE